MTRATPVAIPRDKPKNPEHHHRHHPTASSSSTSTYSASTTTTSRATDEARWRIVLAHEPTAAFFYAVLSTGIYCRTSCPSRRPRRANVRFFDAAADARAAGFRACRRCKPESGDAGDGSPRAAAERQVGRACEFVRRKGGKVQLVDVAGHVGLSPRYLHGLFKEVMGVTPGAYAAGVRGGGSSGEEVKEGEQQQQQQVSGLEGLFAAALPSDDAMNLFDNTNDVVDIVPIDDGCGSSIGGMPMPLPNWDPLGGDWITGGGFDASGFDFGQCGNTYPEWFTECNLDVMRVSRMSSETVESPMSFDSAGYVDPSLLSSLGAPI